MQGTKGPSDNPASTTLANLSQQLFNIWSPTQKQAASTSTDLLKTGGSGATTPIIQNLIQSLRSGLSKTMVDTSQRLGMTRQTGTPFGQRILAETQREGQADIAGAGPDMAMKMLSLLMPMATGGTGTAVGGLSSASQANASVLDSQNRAYSDILSSMIGAGTTAASMGGKALVCWIAEALYGPQSMETWLARWWMTTQAPRWLYHCYRLTGRTIAQHPILYRPLRPLFNQLVRHARQEFYS